MNKAKSGGSIELFLLWYRHTYHSSGREAAKSESDDGAGTKPQFVVVATSVGP